MEGLRGNRRRQVLGNRPKITYTQGRNSGGSPDKFRAGPYKNHDFSFLGPALEVILLAPFLVDRLFKDNCLIETVSSSARAFF